MALPLNRPGLCMLRDCTYFGPPIHLDDGPIQSDLGEVLPSRQAMNEGANCQQYLREEFGFLTRLATRGIVNDTRSVSYPFSGIFYPFTTLQNTMSCGKQLL